MTKRDGEAKPVAKRPPEPEPEPIALCRHEELARRENRARARRKAT